MGGPEFIPDAGANYTSLLRYVRSGSHDSLAALRLEYGRGRVVLTGVHAEIMGCQFPIEVSRYTAASFEHGMQVSADLARAEAERQAVFALLIDALLV